MKKLLVFAFLPFFLCSEFSFSQKINGLSFVGSKDYISQKHIDPIKKVSANYICLMPFAFLKDIKNPNLQYNSKRQWIGETKKGVTQYANLIRNNHLKLMIKPQIWVWRGAFTGTIRMQTEADWNILETAYTSYILDFAKLAETLHAEIFCIGTELEYFVADRPEYWKQLIKEVKKVYKGKLTYAANWNEYKKTSFWKELDFIGVDAYFPTSEKKNPTINDVKSGLNTYKKALMQISINKNKPILFTEFGFRSVDYAARKPWDSKRIEDHINLKAQSNSLEAVFNSFWPEKWFAGGFLWKWFVHHERAGGINNNRFTPQNKPAEKIIKQYYNQYRSLNK